MSEAPDSKKQGLMQRGKGLIDQAVGGLKGRDLALLVDDYTAELTLVAEGLSEDLSLLQQQVQSLSAEQTIDEAGRKTLQERLDQQQKRLEIIEKKLEKQQQKRGTISSVLRQVTIIAGIIAGAWVITALIRLFGG